MHLPRLAGVLACAALGVGVLQGGSGGVHASTARAQLADVPPDEPQPPPKLTPEFIDFGALRDVLLSEFPDSFAGLMNNGDDSLMIFETTPDEALHSFVAARFETAAVRDGVSVDTAPKVSYGTKSLSLEGLFQLKARITDDAEILKSEGVEVTSIGIRDSENMLIVGVASPQDSSETVLAKRYGSEHLRALAWKLHQQADRYNDVAPWNGGDQIITENIPSKSPPFDFCTTGFGIHYGSTHYATTAGHCSAHLWWNSATVVPHRSSANFVGYTTGTVWDGTYSGYDVDTQKIQAPNSTSQIIWTQTATRQYMSAAIGVAVNDPSCVEGAGSPSQSCGSVYAVDWGNGNTQYLVLITNGNLTKDGDSGAPSWRSSGYGPLAQGTHVGFPDGWPNLAQEMKISIVLWYNGATINTIADP